MKKIYVDKNDSAAAIVEKILDAEDKEIVLYVPRFTKLINSINNFRVLKREIDASEKHVEIESVDDDVLEMSKSAGLKAGNPFFKKNRRAVSDIVVPFVEKASMPTHARSEVHRDSHKEAKRELRIDEDPEPEEAEPSDAPEHNERHTGSVREKSSSSGYFNNPKKVFGALIALAGLFLAGYLAVAVLPRAHVAVTLEKINWDFTGSLMAAASVKEPGFASGVARVPGVLLEKSKNMTLEYPANGSESVQRKATGTITIYNAYSSESQSLVKDTRFSSPDGKIFRITKSVTVPGAKIVDNKVVPSTLSVSVIADKPGEAYNIGPATFKIPGFQGTPKYEGFYGESTEPMSGGFVGVTKVATASDIAAAKTDITKALENALKSEIILLVPQDIKIIENSTNFILTKIDVDRVGDANGKFKATAYGAIRVMGFKEADLLSALESKVAGDVSAEDARNEKVTSGKVDLVLKDGYTVTYGQPKSDFGNRQMTVSLKLHSVWVRAIDTDELKNLLAGKTRAALASGPMPVLGIKSMNVDLWPFWVKSIPRDASKISIDVE